MYIKIENPKIQEFLWIDSCYKIADKVNYLVL